MVRLPWDLPGKAEEVDGLSLQMTAVAVPAMAAAFVAAVPMVATTCGASEQERRDNTMRKRAPTRRRSHGKAL